MPRPVVEGYVLYSDTNTLELCHYLCKNGLSALLNVMSGRPKIQLPAIKSCFAIGKGGRH